jgi:hypothetical protein
MIKIFIDWLIKNRKKNDVIHVDIDDNTPSADFKRVLNTLRENKVMVQTIADGIYIRMAGNKNKCECFSPDWAKVITYD